jgi:hypothetical protein
VTYRGIAIITIIAAILPSSLIPSDAAVKHHSRHHRHSTNIHSTDAVILVAKSLGRLRSLARDPITDDQLMKMADTCSSTLAKHGISEPPANIIVAVNLCIPDGATQPLADVFAMYTTLRERGRKP